MKTKISVTLPDTDELTAGLDVRTVHPQLGRNEQTLADAEQALEEARQGLATATETAEAMPAAVRAGKATPMDLEAALVAQRAAAVVMPEHEQHVAEAAGSATQSRAESVKALESEAGRRAASLQAAADRLTPILDALRAAEIALSGAARQAVAGQLDALGRSVEVRVARLRWPSSLADEGLTRSLAHQRDLASSGLTPAEYAREFGVGGHGAKPAEAASASLDSLGRVSQCYSDARQFVT